MAALVFPHLGDDRARGVVLGRQTFQVAQQVLFDLPLGLDHEAEAERSPRRDAATRSQTRPPYQTAFNRLVRPEVFEPLAGPCQVIDFLARRTFQRRPHPLLAGAERLCLVPGLRTDFADMIDPDQRAAWRRSDSDRATGGASVTASGGYGRLASTAR